MCNAASQSGTLFYCLARDRNDASPPTFHFFERYANCKSSDGPQKQPIIQKMLSANYVEDTKIAVWTLKLRSTVA
jgi:hypothetical protein